MKKCFGKSAAVLLVLTMILMSFTGCRMGKETDDTNTVAAIYQGQNIYMDEAKMYVYATQYDDEVDYAFYVAYYYGSAEKYWNSVEEGYSLWEYLLTEAMQRVYQTKVLCDAAKAEGIELSEEDKKKLEDVIPKYKEQCKDSIAFAGATDEMVTKYLTENALANRYYLTMIQDVNTEFDHESFKRKDASGIKVYPLDEKVSPEEPESESENVEGTEATTEGSSEEEFAPVYTEEEKAHNLEIAVTDIKKRLAAGDTVDAIVADWASSDTVSVIAANDIVATPEDAAEPGAEITTYKALAWSLEKKDDIGTAVIRDDDLAQDITYILRLDNEDNEEERQAAEDEELENRKKEMFKEKYQKLLKKYSDFYVYGQKLGTIEFQGKVYESNIHVEGQDEGIETLPPEDETVQNDNEQ